MYFEITARDKDGNPTHVCTNDGYCQISRAYNPEEDGWMVDQLDARDFEEVRAGRIIESLIAEINALRRRISA